MKPTTHASSLSMVFPLGLLDGRLSLIDMKGFLYLGKFKFTRFFLHLAFAGRCGKSVRHSGAVDAPSRFQKPRGDNLPARCTAPIARSGNSAMRVLCRHM